MCEVDRDNNDNQRVRQDSTQLGSGYSFLDVEETVSSLPNPIDATFSSGQYVDKNDSTRLLFDGKEWEGNDLKFSSVAATFEKAITYVFPVVLFAMRKPKVLVVCRSRLWGKLCRS